MSSTYKVEMKTHEGVWEPITNGESDTAAQAQANMQSLVAGLGWTGLRVAEYDADTGRLLAVVAYSEENE